jgi:hypothetical protein
MDICFRMLFKGLDLVDEACPLLVLHWNHGNTIAIYDPDSILVCLSIIRHKFLEPKLIDTMLCYNNIQVLPKYTLSNSIP